MLRKTDTGDSTQRGNHRREYRENSKTTENQRTHTENNPVKTKTNNYKSLFSVRLSGVHLSPPRSLLSPPDIPRKTGCYTTFET